MNQLAQPAPKVEPAVAERAEKADSIRTEAAPPVEAATADKAPAVEPAVPLDPQKNTPLSTFNHGGISVAALRGTGGADFESIAAVLRGAPQRHILKRALPFLFDERDFVSFGEVKRYIVIKGNCCFVFTHKTDDQPIYAIPLEEIKAVLEDPRKPDKASVTISPISATIAKNELVTVLFKYHDGSQAYQFTFDRSNDKSVAKRFLDVVQNACLKSKAVTASIVQANVVGKEAAKAQPSKSRNR